MNSEEHLSCRESQETRLKSPSDNTREKRKRVLLAQFFMIEERYEDEAEDEDGEMESEKGLEQH